ncbi:MAG: CoA transferase [Dehalococcoidia bacterium]|jgi:crotonobetainyl-CoA:carnitine CoA-transferase CaiB-like acyl-CoA transferase
MTEKTALKDIRILDFSWVLAGPYATRILADFGAEVLKVQPLIPPEEDDAFARGFEATWNRNKRGITLNMRKPEGIALAKKLVSLSDAVVENFTPRVMANWGLDYANLKKIKPDIILLSLSAMGHSGPRRDYSGFGPTVQAFSGLTYLTAYPGGAPLGAGTAHADHVAALFACLALLGAFDSRRRTGQGRHIDISQVEAMVSLLSDAFIPPVETVFRGVYRCKGADRWCAITIASDEDWQSFKKALGDPPWALDSSFDSAANRLQDKEALDALIGEWTQKHTAEEVMSLLQRHGIAAGVVRDARDLARDPQLEARGFFVELEHPELGKTIADASPIKLSATPPVYNRAAPLLGQDNDYVYGELLGLSQTEINKLKEDGVI